MGKKTLRFCLFFQLHLATASKTNVEKARRDNSKFLKQQAEEREKHFQEILEEKEKEHSKIILIVNDFVAIVKCMLIVMFIHCFTHCVL